MDEIKKVETVWINEFRKALMKKNNNLEKLVEDACTEIDKDKVKIVIFKQYRRISQKE